METKIITKAELKRVKETDIIGKGKKGIYCLFNNNSRFKVRSDWNISKR